MKILLFVYLFMFFLWVVGSVITVYHTVEYYEPGSKMKLGMYTYFIVCGLIMLLSFYFISGYDWNEPLRF